MLDQAAVPNSAKASRRYASAESGVAGTGEPHAGLGVNRPARNRARGP
ncbi:hypothetical protein SCATT_36810 [Streptantibioticus cattleyicolor NRRL 8057 = DSM 46488]|uniref:Uncharacterized protein n=1 Tax=Streptantibioticus cattleyicolor (strain ATCC 35852 / DSM 46488 / JCM 4925 / NBRC 14057 / NRRL 8057) TaxID=1003195 RepID=G8X060_STREN|nr:hypothetical protein SCATT_36810 [Streptantibioticus cattleyicolor NRRL 8057 = DSM 46488]